MEFGLGAVDEHGRRHLSPEEMAYALTYALTDELPERSKLIWGEPIGMAPSTTRKMLPGWFVKCWTSNSERGHGAIGTFPASCASSNSSSGSTARETCSRTRIGKGLRPSPSGTPELLVHDARMLIEHILKEDKDVIAELLTTNDYFVAHPGDNAYAREFYEQQIAEVLAPGLRGCTGRARGDSNSTSFRHIKGRIRRKWSDNSRMFAEKAESKVSKFKTALDAGINPHPEFPFSNRSRGIADLIYIAPYNLPGTGRGQQHKWDWPIEQPFEMPSGQRSGLLTHPAWLAAWSVNDGNDPIHRGIWVYEKLLAGKLQDVPPDVDAKVPVDPHQTLRERMGLLREERCWNCHHKINPLGETFEMFDDWGRYRTEDFFGEDGKIVTRRDATFDRMLEDGKLTSRKVDATGAIAGTGEAGGRWGRGERGRDAPSSREIGARAPVVHPPPFPLFHGPQ